MVNFNVASVLLALASSVLAIPNVLNIRAAAAPVPAVTYPHAGPAVWIVGYNHNVTWDATNAGSSTGTITLAKAGVRDSSNLASDVPISAGRTIVVTPDVADGTDYTVILTVDGQSSSSAPFTIAHSASSVPSAGSGGSGSSGTAGVATTIVFPSTTIVTTITPGATGGAGGASSVTSSGASGASGASSAASSAASGASSAVNSASSVLSSAISSATSAASSAASTATAPGASHTSGSGSATGAAGGSTSSSAAGSVRALDVTPFKLVAAVGVIVISAGALMF